MSFTESVDELVAADKSGLLGVHPTWVRVRLAEVCAILNGFPFSSKQFKTSGGVPLIRIRDVVRGRSETHFVGDFDPTFIVRHGELVVGMDGDFNCALWSGDDALLNQRVCRLTPDERHYDLRLLVHALPGYLGAINSKTSAITVKHLSSKTVAEIPLPLPPRREQARLAEAIESYFTRLDDAVATLERVQRNLKRYRASVLKAAVEGRLVSTEADLARAEGRSYEPAAVLLSRILVERRRRWEEAELAKLTAKGKAPKDDKWKAKYVEPVAPNTSALPELPEGWCWATWDLVSERVTVGHVGKMKDEYRSDGVPFLRGGNVRANRYEPADLKFVSRRFHEDLAKSALAPGDVLIVRSGAVGTACVVPDALLEANCSDLVIVKKPFGVNPRFGAYYMNSLAQASVRSQQVGVALIHFNTKSAAALPVPIPPAREQDRIVAATEKALSVIDEMEAEVVLNRRRCTRLRQSILSWAFEGRLVDQDPTDEPASVLLDRIRAERASATDKPLRARSARAAKKQGS